MIATNSALKAFCDRLAREPYITVDTEFVRETTYFPILCVIQIASSKEAELIDCCAKGLDLTPFYELMQNEKVVKVFHSCRQDLEIFYYGCGKLPTNLFDSQIAASVIGLGDQISYADLVQHYQGVTIEKGARYSDWSRRPLTNAQADYALADVTHLYKIYPQLVEQLHEKKRESWMKEEIIFLTNPMTYDISPENAYKKHYGRMRKPRDLSILMALSEWREAESQRRNIPRGRFMKDDLLLEVVGAAPTTPTQLAMLRGFPKNYENSNDGTTLLALINEALSRDFITLPPIIGRRHSVNNTQKAFLELLRVLLKVIAENENIAASIIADADDLEEIATKQEPVCHALEGWRLELFGQHAMKLKQGEIALTYKNGKTQVIQL